MTTTTDTPTSSIADLQLALYAEQTRDEYNGWTNRETWATALHLSNDYDLYQIARRIVAGSSNNMTAGEDLERFVTNEVERVLYPTNDDHGEEWARLMISDVGSFWRVDWHAVADSFREEDDNA